MLNFFNIFAYSLFTSKKKKDTFNTIKPKIGLRYEFQGTNPKNLSVLGTTYFEMQL